MVLAEGEPRTADDIARNSKSMDELVVGVVVETGLLVPGTDGSWS